MKIPSRSRRLSSKSRWSRDRTITMMNCKRRTCHRGTTTQGPALASTAVRHFETESVSDSPWIWQNPPQPWEQSRWAWQKLKFYPKSLCPLMIIRNDNLPPGRPYLPVSNIHCVAEHSSSRGRTFGETAVERTQFFFTNFKLSLEICYRWSFTRLVWLMIDNLWRSEVEDSF